MASQKTLLESVKKNFKLNIYEARIWTALLSRGIASAGELADISHVPRSRCYDVLESLEKKGFIIMKIGKPIKYIGVKPEVILDRLGRDYQDDAATQTTYLEAIGATETFREVELLHKSGIERIDVNDISKSIVGRTAINRTIKSMVKNAQRRVIVVADLHGFEKVIKPLKSALPVLRDSPVQVDIYTAADKKLGRKLSGATFHEHQSETHFVSVDDEQALFMVSSTSSVPDYETALWIDSPFFVSAMNVLFEASVGRRR
jgi:HTH-type transcriptional regulator, sugar sensing transcriptional regulator